MTRKHTLLVILALIVVGVGAWFASAQVTKQSLGASVFSAKNSTVPAASTAGIKTAGGTAAPSTPVPAGSSSILVLSFTPNACTSYTQLDQFGNTQTGHVVGTAVVDGKPWILCDVYLQTPGGKAPTRVMLGTKSNM